MESLLDIEIGVMRYDIDYHLGVVSYHLYVYDHKREETTFAHTERVCAAWLYIGKEDALDAEMVRRLKFMYWRKTGCLI